MTTNAHPVPPSVSVPRIRVLYRTGSGEVHLDWPADRIGEAIRDESGTVWVDIDDDHGSNVAGVEALFRDVFGFHPLAIEDALRESNVPKLDDWDRYLYLVFHSIDFDPETDDLRLHELDIFLGKNYLVTYHSEPIQVVEHLRRNLERDDGRRLGHGADHVLYDLLDMGVSEFMPAVEHLDDAIDQAQDEVFRRPTPATLQKIFRVKRSALRLHRILIPQREVLNRLARDQYSQIDDAGPGLLPRRLRPPGPPPRHQRDAARPDLGRHGHLPVGHLAPQQRDHEGPDRRHRHVPAVELHRRLLRDELLRRHAGVHGSSMAQYIHVLVLHDDHGIDPLLALVLGPGPWVVRERSQPPLRGG